MEAKTSWESIFNSAKKNYDDEKASRIAWAAIKKRFHKVGEKWVANSNDFQSFTITNYVFFEKTEVNKSYSIEGYTFVDYVLADNSPDIVENISLGAMALKSFEEKINTDTVYGRLDADHSFLEEMKRKGLSPEEIEEEYKKLDTGIEAINARYDTRGKLTATLKIRNDIYPLAKDYNSVSVEFSHPANINGKVINQARLRGFVLTNNPRLPNARRVGM